MCSQPSAIRCGPCDFWRSTSTRSRIPAAPGNALWSASRNWGTASSSLVEFTARMNTLALDAGTSRTPSKRSARRVKSSATPGFSGSWCQKLPPQRVTVKTWPTPCLCDDWVYVRKSSNRLSRQWMTPSAGHRTQSNGYATFLIPSACNARATPQNAPRDTNSWVATNAATPGSSNFSAVRRASWASSLSQASTLWPSSRKSCTGAAGATSVAFVGDGGFDDGAAATKLGTAEPGGGPLAACPRGLGGRGDGLPPGGGIAGVGCGCLGVLGAAGGACRYRMWDATCC
mmetsp:Transcript_75695/g.198504  ORF Transcript_75695/g.198504 Transcript_75695/m.198504 type:complete len:287 (+) Transcript_75695:1217-2077(+)